MNRKIIVFLTVFIAAAILYALPSFRPAFSQGGSYDVIIIDAGHGGFDGGAVGISGVEEKSLNLEISEKLQALLGFLGYDTVMTRSDDKALNEDDTKSIRVKKISDIKRRTDMVNELKNARLVSIHLNHFSLASCKGAQVFYSDNEDSKRLADAVQDSLRRGLDKDNKRTPQKAGKNIYLLSNVNCPAILVECGFLSNPREEKLLQDEDYQRKIALSIAEGCVIYEN